MKILISFIVLILFALPVKAEQVFLNDLYCYDTPPTGIECPECPDCPVVEPCPDCPVIVPCPDVCEDYTGPRFIASEEDFLDQQTGIVWSRYISRESYQSFNRPGYRLPTINELFSLLDWTKTNADYAEGAIFHVPAEYLLGGDSRGINRLGGPYLTSSNVPQAPHAFWTITGSGSFDKALSYSSRWVLAVKIQ